MAGIVLEKYKGKSRSLLLAFDIGTTYSGISFGVLDPGRIPEIRPVTRYPTHKQAGGDCKIPTVIYYDKNGTVCAIGDEVKKEGIHVDAEDHGWTKAQWFKLHLRPPHMISRASPRDPSESPPPLPPNKTIVHVFADFMQYLRKCAEIYIKDSLGEPLWKSVEENIVYYLSHPNGWGGPQQTIMRQAAVLAGLVPTIEAGHEHVSFVTEGEASLHFCLLNGLAPQNRDDGILIVDVGGGTVDLTAYKRCEDNSFAEISSPKTYFQGSAYVTMRARKYFTELLAGTKYENGVDAMTDRFDQYTKRDFKDRDKPYHIQIGSHWDFDASLKIRRGRLTLSGETMESFFKTSVEKIVIVVKEHCTNAQSPIKTAFLVGGFSASDWLFEKVKEGLKFIDVILLRPDSLVSKAVSDGAIAYCISGAVTSRISQSTYGVVMCTPYNESNEEHRARADNISIHPITGEPVLYGIFKPIVTKGTAVKGTQEFSTAFSQPNRTADKLQQEGCHVLIFAYNGPPKDTMYWWRDEPERYRLLCIIKADVSQVVPTRVRDYYYFSCRVIITFGLAELKAQLAWMENGEEKRGPVTIIFDTIDL